MCARCGSGSSRARLMTEGVAAGAARRTHAHTHLPAGPRPPLLPPGVPRWPARRACPVAPWPPFASAPYCHDVIVFESVTRVDRMHTGGERVGAVSEERRVGFTTRQRRASAHTRDTRAPVVPLGRHARVGKADQLPKAVHAQVALAAAALPVCEPSRAVGGSQCVCFEVFTELSGLNNPRDSLCPPAAAGRCTRKLPHAPARGGARLCVPRAQRLDGAAQHHDLQADLCGSKQQQRGRA